MNILQKHWRLAVVLSVGLFYFVFWLMAKDIIESKEITEDNREEKEVEDVVDVDVSLIVGGRTFKEKMTSSETVLDLMDRLRSNGQITYEILEYTYGTEIVSVNGQAAPEGYQWNVYDGQFQIADFTRLNLSDDKTYMVRLDPISRP